MNSRKILLFLIGILGNVTVNLVGEVTCGEVLMLFALPFFIHRFPRFLKYSSIRIVAGGMLLYLAALIISDIYSHTPAADYMRGWARLFFMMLAFVFVVCAVGKDIRLMASYLIGYTFATILTLAITGPVLPLHKFYLGLPISLLSFFLVGYLRNDHKKIAIISTFAAGVSALLLNSRSIAGITLVAAIFYVVDSGKKAGENTFNARLLIGLIALGIGAGSILQFYNYSAPRGWLGEEAREKYEMQVATSKDGEFSLLSGRLELFFTFPKIAESPFVGHGSWAKDTNFVISRSEELGVKVDKTAAEEGIIPTHSHLFGAWLEAGIIGAIFWGTVTVFSAKLLFTDLKSFGPIYPVLILILISFFWDVLFSPFGGSRRIHNAFMIWILAIPYLNKEISVGKFKKFFKNRKFNTAYQRLR